MSECVTKIKDSEAMYLRVKQFLNISFKSSPALFRRGLQMTTTALKENGPIGTLARSEALPTFYLQQCWSKKWNPHDFLQFQLVEYLPWADARPYDGGFRYNCMMLQVTRNPRLTRWSYILYFHRIKNISQNPADTGRLWKATGYQSRLFHQRWGVWSEKKHQNIAIDNFHCCWPWFWGSKPVLTLRSSGSSSKGRSQGSLWTLHVWQVAFIVGSSITLHCLYYYQGLQLHHQWGRSANVPWAQNFSPLLQQNHSFLGLVWQEGPQ